MAISSSMPERTRATNGSAGVLLGPRQLIGARSAAGSADEQAIVHSPSEPRGSCFEPWSGQCCMVAIAGAWWAAAGAADMPKGISSSAMSATRRKTAVRIADA